MGDNYESRTLRRSYGSPTLLVVLLLLLLINTAGLGYLVYKDYQNNTKQSNFDQQVARLEQQIDKMNTSAAVQTTTTSSSSTAASTSPTTTTDPNQQAVQPETTPSSALPETGNADPSASAQTETDAPAAAEAQTVEGAIDAPTDASTYVVQPGDALSLIAEQHGLSLEQIMLMNGLSDTTVIVGDVLAVK